MEMDSLFPANIKLVPGSAQELEKDEAKKVY